MRNKINPPIFWISTEISQISRKISGFHERFQIFQVKCTRFRGVADPCRSLLFPTARPGGQVPPLPPASGVVAGSGARATGLDLRELEVRSAFYYSHGLAGSSQSTYKSGEKRFLSVIHVMSRRYRSQRMFYASLCLISQMVI